MSTQAQCFSKLLVITLCSQGCESFFKWLGLAAALLLTRTPRCGVDEGCVGRMWMPIHIETYGVKETCFLLLEWWHGLASPSSIILGCLWELCSFCQRSLLYKSSYHECSLYLGRVSRVLFVVNRLFFRAVFCEKAIFAKWPPNTEG